MSIKEIGTSLKNSSSKVETEYFEGYLIHNACFTVSIRFSYLFTFILVKVVYDL
jgi:hypothetical protein